MQTKILRGAGLVISAITSVTLLTGPVSAQLAYDNADLYPGQPDHNWIANNGGFGYQNWTPLSDAAGGGHYMEGVGVNNRQVEGSYSFALYSGSGSYDVSRQLDTAIPVGQFSILTRFDIAGSGPNVVNLRSGNSLASLGAGELISFGIVNGNELSYTDGAGFHLLPSGEARGAIWDWTVDFNAGTGAFSLSVTNFQGGYATTVSGSLEQSGTSVDSFAVINSSTGGNQNVIFDVPEFDAVPEPSTLALIGMATAGMWVYRRRKV